MTRSGQALAPRRIDGKGNEIPAFAALLDGVGLTGAVIASGTVAAKSHCRGARAEHSFRPASSDCCGRQ
ncbi:hypothetical protein [Streptomyces sp. NPDC016626]|uniref:hypothetical protein n=1 Tax=Streptomyces sp. NPDC016626 TaxID=3364968 RepID=UPI003701669F